eukprot:14647114-Alexandrium_andersonii.AAC.1
MVVRKADSDGVRRTGSQTTPGDRNNVMVGGMWSGESGDGSGRVCTTRYIITDGAGMLLVKGGLKNATE